MRLAAGTELVRLGTDRVLYRGGDSVNVRARLLDKNRNTVVSQETMASVYLDDELLQQTLLRAQSDAGGMLTATIDGLDPGEGHAALEAALASPDAASARDALTGWVGQ